VLEAVVEPACVNADGMRPGTLSGDRLPGLFGLCPPRRRPLRQPSPHRRGSRRIRRASGSLRVDALVALGEIEPAAQSFVDDLGVVARWQAEPGEGFTITTSIVRRANQGSHRHAGGARAIRPQDVTWVLDVSRVQGHVDRCDWILADDRQSSKVSRTPSFYG